MRFGSVEFFKALIKTVLAILFFVPLILAVVFGVLFVTKNAELKKAQEENISLKTVADVLVAEKAGTAEDFYRIFDMAGVPYDEFIACVNRNEKLDAQGFYSILSNAGISDSSIITLAASGKNVSGAEFYEIMSANGISDKELLTAVLNKAASAQKLYELLKQCGMSDSDIAELSRLAGTYTGTSSSSSSSKSSGNASGTSTASSNSGTGNTSNPVSSDSPYAHLYTDMYVKAPTEYVREKGTVYLTFDDGPTEHTADKLYILRNRDVKATFFVVPDRSEACAQRLKAIAADGHAIGVHSTSHEYKEIYASVEAFLADFYEAWDVIRDVTGVEVQIFRFPGGSKNDYNKATRDAIIEEMTRRGFRFYDWNVDSGDAAGATWTDMHNSVPVDIKDKYRSIVLMHDRANATLVLDDIIVLLKNEGYKFDKINNDTMPVQFIGPFA